MCSRAAASLNTACLRFFFLPHSDGKSLHARHKHYIVVDRFQLFSVYPCKQDFFWKLLLINIIETFSKMRTFKRICMTCVNGPFSFNLSHHPSQSPSPTSASTSEGWCPDAFIGTGADLQLTKWPGQRRVSDDKWWRAMTIRRNATLTLGVSVTAILAPDSSCWCASANQVLS